MRRILSRHQAVAATAPLILISGSDLITVLSRDDFKHYNNKTLFNREIVSKNNGTKIKIVHLSVIYLFCLVILAKTL